eukprot:5721123-Amphidinium_carterae.1
MGGASQRQESVSGRLNGWVCQEESGSFGIVTDSITYHYMNTSGTTILKVRSQDYFSQGMP